MKYSYTIQAENGFFYVVETKDNDPHYCQTFKCKTHSEAVSFILRLGTTLEN